MVKMMAWHQIGIMPLPEHMMTKIYDTLLGSPGVNELTWAQW